MNLAEITQRVRDESKRAESKHGPADWSRHQFYGILLEEVDELWDAIKKDDQTHVIQDEIIQVIAVCVRYLERRF